METGAAYTFVLYNLNFKGRCSQLNQQVDNCNSGILTFPLKYCDVIMLQVTTIIGFPSVFVISLPKKAHVDVHFKGPGPQPIGHMMLVSKLRCSL